MSDSLRIEREAAEWLVRRHSDTWHSGETDAFSTWVDASLAHRIAYLRLEETWRQAGRLRVLGAGLPGGSIPARRAENLPFPDLSQWQPRPSTPAPSRRWWRFAQAGTVLLAMGVTGWLGWQATGRYQASYASGIGQIQTITLMDGSVLTLSSNSHVDVRIGRGYRDVTLRQGEAIFDVAHDSHRRFRVQADDHTITAVGTRFSVRHDPETLRVIVTEGRVRLDHESDPASELPDALLSAGMVAHIDSRSLHLETLPDDEAERLLDWRNGFISVENATLAELVAEFNRYSLRPIELADAQTANLAVGGTFRWNNADEFVGLLEQIFPIRAEHKPDGLILHAR